MGKGCSKVIILVGLLEEEVCQKAHLVAFLERNLVFIYLVLLALEPSPLSVAEGKRSGFHHHLASLAFRGELCCFIFTCLLQLCLPLGNLMNFAQLLQQRYWCGGRGWVLLYLQCHWRHTALGG